jgi:hypothetical protein
MGASGMRYIPSLMGIGTGTQAILWLFLGSLKGYNVVRTDWRDL